MIVLGLRNDILSFNELGGRGCEEANWIVIWTTYKTVGYFSQQQNEVM